jgi:hypothetical protein
MAGATSSVGAIRVQNSASNHFNLGIAQNNDFALNYNLNISQASDLLRITPAGSMGLGTIAPAARLHVAGDVRIDNTGSGHAQTIEAPNAFGDASILLRSASTGSQFIEFRDIGDAGSDANVGIADGEENLTFAVNGAPRMTLTPTGRVGINTVAPTEILHVNGNARIDGSITISTTTRHLSLSPFDFAPQDDSTNYGRSVQGLAGQTIGSLVGFGAPVHLPDGATITAVSITCLDNSANDFSFNLFRGEFATAAVPVLAIGSSSSAVLSYRTFTETLSHVVDNQNYAYSLVVSWTPPAGGGMLLFGARIDYTVTQPLP